MKGTIELRLNFSLRFNKAALTSLIYTNWREGHFSLVLC